MEGTLGVWNHFSIQEKYVNDGFTLAFVEESEVLKQVRGTNGVLRGTALAIAYSDFLDPRTGKLILIGVERKLMPFQGYFIFGYGSAFPDEDNITFMDPAVFFTVCPTLQEAVGTAMRVVKDINDILPILDHATTPEVLHRQALTNPIAKDRVISHPNCGEATRIAVLLSNENPSGKKGLTREEYQYYSAMRQYLNLPDYRNAC